jgi:uncharacterized protein YaeQ
MWTEPTCCGTRITEQILQWIDVGQTTRKRLMRITGQTGRV